MALEHMSDIQRFFEGSTVFITGATGLLGKLVLEKLLRTCKGIETIYILIREKKGKSVQQRYEELFNAVIFDGIRKENSQLLHKVTLMDGDCALPNLGLSEENQKKLINEVNCVFHCAANIRFNEKIRTATYVNVRATRDILILSKNMKDLKSLVHISTAYSFCVNREIKEEFYEPSITGDKLLVLTDTLKDDALDRMTPTLLGKYPNPYIFTKAVSEEVVKSYGTGLPIAVVRPSAIISTVKEPIPGWIDNIYGPTGVTVGVSLGVLRVLHAMSDKSADIIPADYVTNCTVAASWNVGNKWKENDPHDIEVYNYISCTQNPITWGRYKGLVDKNARNVPSPLTIWYPFSILVPWYTAYQILNFFLHTAPAYLADFIAYCIGKKPIFVKGYKKINTFLEVITYFATNEWIFHNTNTQSLWKQLSEKDKNLFEFDMSGFNWDDYFPAYVRQGRVSLLNDPLDTLPQGRRKYNMLAIIHYALLAVLLVGLLRLVMLFWKSLL